MNPDLVQSLRQRIIDVGLIAHVDEILSYVRPSVDVYLEAPSEGTIGESRFGGAPDLPPSIEWPRNSEGKALHFLLQVDLKDLPAFVESPLPQQGMLYFFVGFVEMYLDIEHRVIVWQGEEALQTARPPEASELVDDYYLGLPPQRLRFELCPDLPLWGSNEGERLRRKLTPKEFEDFTSLERDQAGFLCQFFGYPLSFTQDAREDAYGVREVASNWFDDYDHRHEPDLSDAMHWQLLFRLHSLRDPRFMLGDVGFLNVLIRDSDLAVLNFANTFVGLQDT